MFLLRVHILEEFMKWFFKVVISGFFAASVLGQAPAPDAAALYWKAVDHFPNDATATAAISNWERVPMGSGVDQTIAAGAASLDLLNQAAQFPHCNWHLDYSKGPLLLLPQLNKGHALAQLACLRARSEFVHSQWTAAVDDLANVIALGRHLSEDKTLIGFLVRCNVEDMAIRQLALHLPQLDKTALAHLSQRLNKLPPGSDLADAIAMERTLDVCWIQKRAQAAAAVGDPMDWGGLEKWMDQGNSPQWDAIRDAPPEQLLSKISPLDRRLSAVEELARSADTQKQKRAKLNTLAASDNADAFAVVFVPDYRRVFDMDAAESTQIMLLQTAVAMLQNGPDQINSARDPVNHDPIQYQPSAAGFALTSTVLKSNVPVKLQVGD